VHSCAVPWRLRTILMEPTNDAVPVSPPADESLVWGGPFFRVLESIGLQRPGYWHLAGRILVLVAIGWLPLFLITAFLHPEALMSLLRDYRVNSRLLIAVPAMLIGETLMESRFRAVLKHIRRAGLLDVSDLAYMEGIIARLIRARDSFLPELAILLLLIVHTTTSFRGLVDATPWLSRLAGSELHLTAAGWYAVLVSSAVFQFLIGVGLWKWLLWTFFAFKLSAQNLRLIPTHPDGHAGLGFLGLTSAAFAPIAFSATAVIAATWRNDILHHGAHLLDFKLPAIVLVVLIALIALGPLAFFVPCLGAVRRSGILEYGILGQLHSSDFQEKWILHRAGREVDFPVALEITTLANFGQAYVRIEQMSPILADKGSLYTLGAAVLIPALPMILAQIPLAVIIGELLKAVR